MRKADQTTRFILLTSPRSGSTWLVSVLNKIDGITAYGELFLSRQRKPKPVEWDVEFSQPRFIEARSRGIGLRPFNVFAYLDDLYRKPGAVGFKLMYSQMNRYPDVLAYAFLHRVRVIHLVRRNSLDMLISQAVRRTSRRSHRLVGETALEEVQVDLNPRTLIARIEAKQRKHEKTRRLLTRMGLPTMEVSYEDLVAEPGTIQTICRFLSLPAVPGKDGIPTSHFVKIQQKGHAQVIRNYAAVQEVLSGTPYASFLD